MHYYTAPKLFLFELLPSFITRAVVLDADLLVLRPICKLADDFGARILQPGKEHTAFGYAFESQNEYNHSDANPHAAVVGDLVHNRTANGGVAVHELVRMRSSTHYHNLLQQVFNLDFDDRSLGLGKRQMLRTGDQDVLALSASLFPAEFDQVRDTLPCEWNWQLCVLFYAFALDGGGDNTCQQPPAAVHFNCGNEVKQAGIELLQLLHEDTKLKAVASNEARSCPCTAMELRLQRAFVRNGQLVGNCRNASIYFPGIESRACNSTYLLQHCEQGLCGHDWGQDPNLRHVVS